MCGVGVRWAVLCSCLHTHLGLSLDGPHGGFAVELLACAIDQDLTRVAISIREHHPGIQ